jgi:hypothetical protein
MEHFEFFCPVHGVVATRHDMGARLDPSKCNTCHRRLRFAPEGEVTRQFSEGRATGLC